MSIPNPFARQSVARRVYNPQGFNAPDHSAERRNYEAACVAAREVRGRAIHCPLHRESLEAWEAGERSWPWPDPTPEQIRKADDAMRALCRGLA